MRPTPTFSDFRQSTLAQLTNCRMPPITLLPDSGLAAAVRWVLQMGRNHLVEPNQSDPSRGGKRSLTHLRDKGRVVWADLIHARQAAHATATMANNYGGWIF